MNITQSKIVSGLLAEETQVNRSVASAVSQLSAQADLMAAIGAYLFTEVQDPQSMVDAEHVAKVTADFQAQLGPLSAVMVKLAKIEALGTNDELGNPDQSARAAALADLVASYGLSPATFADRYK